MALAGMAASLADMRDDGDSVKKFNAFRVVGTMQNTNNDQRPPHCLLPPGRRLESWKEIAEYLHVTDRTARSWERDRQLPVRRIPGPRGRVWAEAAELDRWILNPDSRVCDQPESVQPRRRSGILAAVLSLCALAACSALWGVASRESRIADVVESRGMLTAFSETGRVLWRVDLGGESPPLIEASEQVRFTRSLLVDSKRDGKQMLLYPYRGNAPAQANGRHQELRCYSNSGELRWAYRVGRSMTTRTLMTFTDDYFIDGVATVRLRNGQPGILVTSHHIRDSPSEIALLSMDGQLLRAYYHFGHAAYFKVLDLNQDGADEIYLAGIANGYKRAVFLALDPNTMGGCSRESDPQYQLIGDRPTGELARVLLPATSLGRQSWDYSLPGSIDLVGEEILVGLTETHWAGPRNAGLVFHFGKDLRFRRVTLNDGFELLYDEARRAGRITHRQAACGGSRAAAFAPPPVPEWQLKWNFEAPLKRMAFSGRKAGAGANPKGDNGLRPMAVSSRPPSGRH